MKKKPKIVLGTGKLNDRALENMCTIAIASITGNNYFASSMAELQNLVAATKTFSDALVASKSRDIVKIEIKNNARLALQAAIEIMAGAVTFAANGRVNAREIMLSSGLPVNAENTSSEHLGIIENFSVTVGETTGSATLSVNRVSEAISYIYLFGQNNTWLHEAGTKPYFTATGLQSGQVYNFKIGAVGFKDQVEYSEVITKMVV